MIDRLPGDFVQWLRGFYYTAKERSVSGAAGRMGLRQPAVSHLLRALENDLGVRLFERGPKTMELTDEGQQLMERCIQLFDLVREIKFEVGREEAQELKGTVSLVTTYSVAQNYLPGPLRAFNLHHPDVRFQVSGMAEVNQIVRLVLGGEIDLALAQAETVPEPLQARPLFTSRLVLVALRACARERGWVFTRDADGCLADMAELDGVPFIRFSPASGMTRYIETRLRASGVEPQYTATVNNSTLLKLYAQAGMGVTILDDFTLANDADFFDQYPLPGPENRRVYQLITRTKRYLPPQAKAFARFLQDWGNGAGQSQR